LNFRAQCLQRRHWTLWYRVARILQSRYTIVIDKWFVYSWMQMSWRLILVCNQGRFGLRIHLDRIEATLAHKRWLSKVTMKLPSRLMRANFIKSFDRRWIYINRSGRSVVQTSPITFLGVQRLATDLAGGHLCPTYTWLHCLQAMSTCEYLWFQT